MPIAAIRGCAIERDRAHAGDEGVAQARGGVLPTVTLQGQGGVLQSERFGRSTSAGITDPDPESVSIRAVEPIFRGGRTFYDFQPAATGRTSATKASSDRSRGASASTPPPFWAA